MRETPLTFWISRYECLPVRAIPYVTRWQWYGPDTLAKYLARNYPSDSTSALTAYRLSGKKVVEVEACEWDPVLTGMELLKSELEWKFSSSEERRVEWRRRAVGELPAGMFVWRNEFEAALQDDPDFKISPAPRAGNDELKFSLASDSNIRMILMEGFEEVVQHQAFYSSGAVRRPAKTPDEGPWTIYTSPISGSYDAGSCPHDETIESEPAPPSFENPKARGANALEDKIAALFDPVPAETLESLFPAKGKWKGWVDHAHENGLAEAARVSRGKFNPYKAALWFLGKGVANWNLARCYRVLANNLPARSRDSKHLLMGELD